MAPVLCMITDRRRFGDASAGRLLDQIEAAAHAGVHLVQVRERDLDGRALAALVSACLDRVRGTRTRIVVNDRTDVAIAVRAHGVHLRADSVPALRVRSLGGPLSLVGRSVHSEDEAEAIADAGGVDYLLFGTVFPTGAKPGRPAAGIAALARAVARVPVPVLAVGGVTAASVAGLGRSGAAGFAAISFFADRPATALAEAIRDAARTFDTPVSVP